MSINYALITVIMLTLLSPPTSLANEVSEVKRISELPGWAGSRVEVRMWDNTRVDLLTDEYAIEADWSYKWAEAIGQSLYYAHLTGKKPGILLLVKDSKAEQRYVYRCQTVAVKHNIRLWIEVIPK